MRYSYTLFLYARLLCFLLLLLTGCRRGQKKPDSGEPIVAEMRIISPVHDRRISDVSIPLGVDCYDASRDEHEAVIYYKTDFTVDLLRDFYRFDMERLGWSHFASSDGIEEHILLFDRPHSWCAVLMRQQVKGCKVTLFIGNKLTEYAIAPGCEERDC